MEKILAQDPNKLQLAHFSKGELEMLDMLQGKPKFVELLGIEGEPIKIRAYPDLILVFNDPNVRAIFEEIFKDNNKVNGNKDSLGTTQVRPNELNPDDDSDDPLLETIKDLGTKGDDELAFLPIGVLNYFDALLGKTSTNPNTGLPQYGWLDDVLGFVTKPVAKAFGIKHGFLAKPEKATKAFVKQISKNPIANAIIQTGVTLGTAGLSLPAQLAAQAVTAGALSRGRGNKWNDVLKDAAIAGVTHGAGAYARSAGYSQAGISAAKAGSHYGSNVILKGRGDLGQSALLGLGDYVGSKWDTSKGVSGLWDATTGTVGDIYSGITGAAEGAGNFFGFGGGTGTAAAGAGSGTGTAAAGAGAGTTSPGALNTTPPASTSWLSGSTLGVPNTVLALSGGALGLQAYGKAQEAKNQKRLRALEENLTEERNQALANYIGYDTPLQSPTGQPLGSRYGVSVLENPRASFEGGRRNYDDPLVPNPIAPSIEDLRSGMEYEYFIPASRALNMRRGY
jgi:hypothetical protein